jgi:AcrR family transcriptional regulator
MVVAREEPGPVQEAVDPRVERSRELVLAATIELLAEVGYGPLAVEAVASRSGVAKSTIYRHWPGKEELAAEAFARLRDEAGTVPPPGPVKERVVTILRALALKTLDPEWHQAACMPAVIEGGARSTELATEAARMAEERARPLVEVLQAGIDTGELVPAVDASVLADSLAAPILLRRLFHREPFPPDEVPALVDQILGTG